MQFFFISAKSLVFIGFCAYFCPIFIRFLAYPKPLYAIYRDYFA